MTPVRAGWWVRAALIGLLLTSPALARDAAFIQPSAAPGDAENAFKIEPKDDVDVGDTTIGMTRRTTLFFVNNSGASVEVQKIDLNSDSNVQAEISDDDCKKQGTIAPTSRCSLEVSVTPTSPGPWSVEVLMTHNGAGHIAHAKLSGKTSGTVAEKKDMGLAMTSKEVTPVTFGDVQVGDKAIRSALMINDSPDPITLYSIDVIEAGNGLERLEQGCAVDMELKPGESCPVTLVWAPVVNGQVSTDLIIRHSGRLGFAVIPLRGKASGGAVAAASDTTKEKVATDANAKFPPPPSPDEIAKAAAGKITPVSVIEEPKIHPDSSSLHLIGTIGNRAVVLLPDGSTKTFASGDEIPLNGGAAKVIQVLPKSMGLIVDGQKKELILGAAAELTYRAMASEKTTKTQTSKPAEPATPPPVTSLSPAALAMTPLGATTSAVAATAARAAALKSGSSGSLGFSQ